MDTARELFADRGYAATSTTEIVGRAGVTRGALYHHFQDKEDLFRAVYEDVEEGVTALVLEAVGSAPDPLSALVAGSEAFLDACLAPDVQRIVLLEGPTVLGWRRWRELDEQYGLGITRMGLQAAMDAGAIRPMPLDPLAHMMLGALVEAGLVVAHADDPVSARREMGEALAGVIEGLAAGR